jgi:hypothetical protein
MDVSHTSTSMFEEKSMKKMVPSIYASNQENVCLAWIVNLPWFDDNF